LNNPQFKLVEFDQFRNDAGSNYFVLSPKKWIDTTNAIGITSKSGKYGGTFAHQDIAFEFASWISAKKDMVPGELFPTLHRMAWRMGAWMHGTFESCSHANMQSFIPLFHHSRCERSEPTFII
jgi:hypothetical protein